MVHGSTPPPQNIASVSFISTTTQPFKGCKSSPHTDFWKGTEQQNEEERVLLIPESRKEAAGEYTENEVEDEDEEGSCEKENPITTSSSTEKKKKKTQPAWKLSPFSTYVFAHALSTTTTSISC